jgi:hypothetical protein
VTAPPRAAEPPDDGLLEFLGSVDSEDRDWHDYLARTDIDKVARRTAADPAARQGAAVPPAVPPANAPPSPSANPPATKQPVTPP